MTRPPHRRRTLPGALVLVCLLLMTIDAREAEGGPLDQVQQQALTAFAPLAEGADRLVRPARTALGEAGELLRLREEHAALRAELEALRTRAALLEDLERENAALREAMGMRERLPPATIAARAIGRGPGTSSWSVLLDVGSRDGVRPDMAVVAADGLVGKVSEVAPAQSRVELAVSPNAGYAVRVAGTGQHGLVSGRGEGPLELLLLDAGDAAVPAGSEVLTRAFPGSTIPDGIPLGVVEPGPQETSQGRPLAVRPHTDPARLRVVLVVVGEPPLPAQDGLGPG